MRPNAQYVEWMLRKRTPNISIKQRTHGQDIVIILHKQSQFSYCTAANNVQYVQSCGKNSQHASPLRSQTFDESSSLLDETSSSSSCFLKPGWVRPMACSMTLAPMLRIRASQAKAKMIHTPARLRYREMYCFSGSVPDRTHVMSSNQFIADRNSMKYINQIIPTYLLRLLTHHIISKPDGAESDEGEIEALAEGPALHVTEQKRRDDQEQQAARDEEQAHGQSLHGLLQRGEIHRHQRPNLKAICRIFQEIYVWTRTLMFFFLSCIIV